MNFSLLGKHALVCGGSKGIGKAIGIALAEMGANVTLVARSANTLSAAVQELDKSKGQDHDFLMADFEDLQDLRRKVSGLLVVRKYQILINNTGGPKGGPIIDAQPEEFADAFNKHIICSQILTKLLIDGMRQESYGRIINVISTSVKEPIEGLGVSNTIRAAMGNWSKTMATELAPWGITVNNILPGFTDTDRLQQLISDKASKAGISESEVSAQMSGSVPMKRFALPSEIAAAAAFLASPAAGYITGINLPVDGGRTRSL